MNLVALLLAVYAMGIGLVTVFVLLLFWIGIDTIPNKIRGKKRKRRKALEFCVNVNK